MKSKIVTSVALLVLVIAGLFYTGKYYKEQWTPEIRTEIVTDNYRKKFRMDYCTVTVNVIYDIPRKPNLVYLPSERFKGIKKALDYDCPVSMVDETTQKAREWMNTDGAMRLIEQLMKEKQ